LLVIRAVAARSRRTLDALCDLPDLRVAFGGPRRCDRALLVHALFHARSREVFLGGIAVRRNLPYFVTIDARLVRVDRPSEIEAPVHRLGGCR
jgi:hypothetical protein